MSRKKWLLLSLGALVALMVVLAIAYIVENRPERYEDRETFPEETYVPKENVSVAYTTGLMAEDIANTSADEWLAGCAGADRNEHFQAYALRHRADAGENTTFTYLIYYRNADSLPTAEPIIEQGKSEWRVNLTFSTASNPNGYSLLYLSVTLPTTEAPHLRLVHDGESVGMLVTESEGPIAQPFAEQ